MDYGWGQYRGSDRARRSTYAGQNVEEGDRKEDTMKSARRSTLGPYMHSDVRYQLKNALHSDDYLYRSPPASLRSSFHQRKGAAGDETADLLQAPANSVRVAKGLLMFFAVTFTVSGLILLGLGFYLCYDPHRVQMYQLVLLSLYGVGREVGTILYYLTLGVIGAGAAIVVAGTCGVWGAIRESTCGIIFFILCLFLLIAGHLATGIFAVTYHLRTDQDLREELVIRLQRSYNTPGGEYFTAALDYAQTQFLCCGISGESDYDSSAWRRQSLGGATIRLPLTCCKLANRGEVGSYLNPVPTDVEKCMDQNQDAARTFKHQQGCIDDIIEWSSLEFVLLITVSFGACLFECLGIIVAVYMTRNIKKRDKFR